MKSLTQCFKIHEFIRSNNIQKEVRIRYESDHAHYCWKCKVSVYFQLKITVLAELADHSVSASILETIMSLSH